MKRKYLVICIALGLLVTLAFSGSCVKTEPTSTTQSAPAVTEPTGGKSNTPQPTTTPAPIAIPTISTLDAYNLIQKNKDNPDFIIIDVRTADEFKGGHIPNAINMDYYSPDFKSDVGKLDRNKQYLVYCGTGIRGAEATRIMVDIGFKEVDNLSGGTVQWIKDGHATVI
jgi:rhodanese-related sulfurtransferase